MPEINNSLATQIQQPNIDLGKTLLTVGQIRSLNAKSSLEEQEHAHLQGVYNRNDNYNIPEVQGLAQTKNIQAETATKHAELAGRAGNIITNDPTPAGVDAATDFLKKAGIDVPGLAHGHLRSLPPDQIKQAGQRMVDYGRSATSQTEQNPGQVGNRAAAGASGAIAGQVDEPYRPPGGPMTPPQIDNAIKTRTNRDGSARVLSTADIPDQPGAPMTSLEKKAIIDARTAERTGTAQKNVEEFAGYKQSAANSSTTKTVLRSLQDDAERVYTGKGATNKGDAQKWILAASNLPGVGSLVKHFAGDLSDPVAALENIRKNIGIISRQAVGDIHETSAAALESVQNSLPTEEMSSKGLKLATSQMMAIEDFKQARLQAAQKWKDSHNGSLDGFASDWSKNMGPATFVMARLPKEEQIAVRDRLSKTAEGKRTLEAIDKQLQWGHKHGLDSVID